MIAYHFFLLSIKLFCYTALFNRDDVKVEALPAIDIGYLATKGVVMQNVKATANPNPKIAAAAAAELDILMPPIEFTEAIAGIADASFVPSNANIKGEDENFHASNWYLTYDALAVALVTIVMLVIMVFVTHCIWRRHIERRESEWETENARIFCSTPCYIDQSQILVY